MNAGVSFVDHNTLAGDLVFADLRTFGVFLRGFCLRDFSLTFKTPGSGTDHFGGVLSHDPYFGVTKQVHFRKSLKKEKSNPVEHGNSLQFSTMHYAIACTYN
jgi:hypothetical protein